MEALRAKNVIHTAGKEHFEGLYNKLLQVSETEKSKYNMHLMEKEKTCSQEIQTLHEEIQQLKATQAKEVSDLHIRVRQALEKKTNTIQSLQEQLSAATSRAVHAEELVQLINAEITSCGSPIEFTSNSDTRQKIL